MANSSSDNDDDHEGEECNRTLHKVKVFLQSLGLFQKFEEEDVSLSQICYFLLYLTLNFYLSILFYTVIFSKYPTQ